MNVPGWLELFLRTFPAEFREAHRRELEEFVSLELSQAGRRWPWVALRMGLDLARTGLSLRLRPVRRGIWAALKNDGGEGWMMSGLGDLKLAVRGLGRSRGFSAVVVLTLALGVGLNTALFSVVNAVLLRPLDYDRPDRLVYVEARLQTPDVSVTLSGGDLRDLRAGVGALENVEGIALIRQNLNGAGLPRQADVGWVSAGFLAMLGVEPALGRVHHEDDPEGRVVVSHDLWKDAFGSDPEALGKTVQLDGYPYVVIGVLPSDFRLHLPAHGGGAQIQPEVWKNPDSFWQNGDIWAAQGPEFGLLRILGRLGEGAAVADAQNGVDAVTLDLRSRYSAYETEDLAMNVAVLQERVVEEVRSTLTLLLGAVAFVLLIACANVANLLLVRGQSRRREMAVRIALGSPRLRVGRFLLLESFVLALSGAGAGILLAAWAVASAPRLAPPSVPLIDAVRLDGTVLGFALIAALLTTLVVGALPAIVAVRTDPSAVLGNGRAVGAHGVKVRDGLVVAQLALSIVLLVGAGLLTTSLMHLQRVDPGFDPSSMYTFSVSIPGAQYGWPEEAGQFYRDVEARVAELPGVESAGVVWPMPFSTGWSGDHEVMEAEAVRLGLVGYRLATEAYFPTAKIPLVGGRHFNDGDARHVVLISEVVAQRAWPGLSPVGRMIRANPWGGGMEAFEVIGVVGDVRDGDLREPTAGAIYFDARSWSWVDWEVHVLARTDVPETVLLPALRTTLAAIDSEVPLARPAAMEDIVRRQTAAARFVLFLLGAFAVTAGVLALVGLYGVVSYSVGRRSREFGVRLALGAPRSGIQRAVVKRGALLAALGVSLGLAGAWGLADLLDALLFEVTSTDPLTYSLVAVWLGAGAVLASWVPAWRASRLDPVEVLRSD